MFEPLPFGHRGGSGSDRHGVPERHPPLAIPVKLFDPGDCPPDRIVTEYDAEVFALGQRRAEVPHP